MKELKKIKAILKKKHETHINGKSLDEWHQYILSAKNELEWHNRLKEAAVNFRY